MSKKAEFSLWPKSITEKIGKEKELTEFHLVFHFSEQNDVEWKEAKWVFVDCVEVTTFVEWISAFFRIKTLRHLGITCIFLKWQRYFWKRPKSNTKKGKRMSFLNFLYENDIYNSCLQVRETTRKEGRSCFWGKQCSINNIGPRLTLHLLLGKKYGLDPWAWVIELLTLL